MNFKVKRTQKIKFTEQECIKIDNARLVIKKFTGKEISVNNIIKKSTVDKIKEEK